MSEQETVQQEQEQVHPDISANLMWEDVQIGIRTVRNALILFAIGATIARPILGELLAVVMMVLGGMGVLHGLYLYFEIPQESEARMTHRGTILCLFVCFLTATVNYFLDENSRVLTLAAVIAGALAHLLFVFTVMSIGDYLKVDGLFSSASRYLLLAIILSATFVAIYIFAPMTGFYILLTKMIGIVAAIFVMLLASQTATTIQLLRAGETLASVAFEAETASHEVHETDVYEVVANPSPTTAFSDEQWHNLEVDDRGTAKVFVSLITGIFSMGVVIYLIILMVVA